jgi:hypothetical protein
MIHLDNDTDFAVFINTGVPHVDSTQIDAIKARIMGTLPTPNVAFTDVSATDSAHDLSLSGAQTVSGATGADLFEYNNDTSSTAADTDVINNFEASVDKIDIKFAPTQGVIYMLHQAPENGKAVVHLVDDLYSAGFVLKVVSSDSTELSMLDVDTASVTELQMHEATSSVETLTGTSSDDVFYFSSNTFSSFTQEDTVSEFVVGTDRLLLPSGTADLIFTTLPDVDGKAAVRISDANSNFTVRIISSDLVPVTIGDISYNNAINSADGGSLSAAYTDQNPAYPSLDLGAGAQNITATSDFDLFKYYDATHSTLSDPDVISNFATGTDALEIYFTPEGTMTLIHQAPENGKAVAMLVDDGASSQFSLTLKSSTSANIALTDIMINGNSPGDGLTEIWQQVATSAVNTLTGANQIDYFKFTSLSHSTTAMQDTITEFLSGTDKIVLPDNTMQTYIIAMPSEGGMGVVRLIDGQGFDVKVVGADASPFVTTDIAYSTTPAIDLTPQEAATAGETLTSTSSNDLFVFDAANLSTSASTSSINDFDASNDKLELQFLAHADLTAGVTVTQGVNDQSFTITAGSFEIDVFTLTSSTTNDLKSAIFATHVA